MAVPKKPGPKKGWKQAKERKARKEAKAKAAKTINEPKKPTQEWLDQVTPPPVLETSTGTVAASKPEVSNTIPFSAKFQAVEYYRKHKEKGMTYVEAAANFGVNPRDLELWNREAEAPVMNGNAKRWSERLHDYTTVPEKDLDTAYELGKRDAERLAKELTTRKFETLLEYFDTEKIAKLEKKMQDAAFGGGPFAFPFMLMRGR